MARKRRRVRRLLRKRHFDAYEIRFETEGFVPHPDKGYEDEYSRPKISRRLLITLLILLPISD